MTTMTPGLRRSILRLLRDTGLDCRHIAVRVGVTHGAVHRLAKRHGIDLRLRTRVWRASK